MQHLMAEAGGNVYNGIQDIKLANITKQVGEYQLDIKLLENLIKQLESLVQSLMEGDKGIQTQAVGMTDLFNSMMGGLSKDMTSLSQSAA